MTHKKKTSARNVKRPIPLFKVFMNKDAVKSVGKVLLSGYIGQGQKVNEFENKLTKWLRAKHVLTVNSATSAEHLALHLLKSPSGIWGGLKASDEVLATPLTCTATNWPILANNLKIKWVDVNESNLNIDLEDLERKITPKTKVIMLVHWGGYPVDLDRLNAIREKAYSKHGFKPRVIEDCAHAFGATYKGKKIGNHGNMCTFSFQAIKHMNSVDGGILVVPSKELYRRGKLLRWYGIDREQNTKDFRCEEDIKEWGFKFHMNDVNAAVGIENLKYAGKIISKHRANAEFYNKHLEDIDGIRLHENKKDRQSS
ncbi:MAG: aminotransferase class V-fold PLP-dependent enzyme, partial [Candidatus Omnitrophica bacterium]|nr:aminotransferase class V-fold PLP-dependent enzyme [Candidatus Omnitrophota bacterium]